MDVAGNPNLVFKDSKFVISFSSILSSKYFLRNGFNSLSPNSVNSTVFESLMIEDSMCWRKIGALMGVLLCVVEKVP